MVLQHAAVPRINLDLANGFNARHLEPEVAQADAAE
jgi:hypothetical protein